MRRLACLLLIAVVGCDSDSIEGQAVQLSSLAFEVPAEWQRQDANRRGVSISEWAPYENARKESITVIRTETSPAVAKAGVGAVEPLLAAAQRSLRGVRASRVARLTTAKGMSGARVDIDFVPPGTDASYHRVHVVLVDGTDALVHVLYTARSPSSSVLDLVLASIHREEA